MIHFTSPAACTLGSAPGPTFGNEYGKTLPLLISANFCIYMLRLYCRLQVTACYFPFQFSAQFQRYRRPLRRQLKRPPCVTQPSHSVTATLLLPRTTTPLFFPGQPGISSTICKQYAPRSREITTPAPHHSIFTGRMLFLTPNRQCQSTEGSSLSHCISCATRQRRILR